MNERIKELHDQACKLDWEQYPNAIPDGERIQQKFAELFARDVIVDFYRHYLDLTSDEDITVQVDRYIKHNFRVE